MSDPAANAPGTKSVPADKPASLSAEKQRLLALRLKGAAKTTGALKRIPQRAAGQPPPLSAAQHQMWIIDRMNPGNPAYNIPVAYRITGPLDIGALEESFNRVIERHESWRTTFGELDGHPVQQIHAKCRMQISITDFSHLPAEQRERESHALAAEEAVKPFDLHRLPLLRVSLFKLGENEHVILITVHHIVADGLSLCLMFDELDVFYRAAISGTAPHLPELPAQYADFAAWQEQELSGDRHSQQLEHWRQHLKGELPVLEIAPDKPRPLRQSFKGSNADFTISKSLTQALAALGTQERCTFFVTVLAALQILLMRYSRAGEVIIGTPVANRPLPEFAVLIGNFLNIVALRCDLAGDPDFLTLLRRSRETTLLALSNADVPFEKVVKLLGGHRDPGRNPVFQSLVQVLPWVRARLGDLSVARFDFEVRFSQVDLALNLYEEPDGSYAGQFQYSTDLFAAETAERLSLNFVRLLNEIVRDPSRKIGQIPILADAEKDLLLNKWNQTESAWPGGFTVQELIAQQAGRTPDSVAVEFEGLRLTYTELDRRANQIAHRLHALGAAPGALIGVCVERSAEMVAAVLGILKTGAAYVPLDPAFPAARLAMMIEDADMPLIVTQRALAPTLPPHRSTVVLLDDDAPHADVSTPALTAGALDDLAYVIFTSGSTGRPKGVEISQRALVNFLHSMQRSPGMTCDDVLLAVTTLSFDIAGLEIFLPLIIGARLVVLTRETAMDGSSLLREIERRRATMLQATPATWRLLLESRWRGTPGLKALIGGEACPRELAAQLLPKCGELWNMYGPTETTIWSTLQKLGATDTAISIGRPIANTRTYILDAAGEPTPIGVPGELHIGGTGLARGYLKRADLTAEKFIRDPFSVDTNARLYRTGDLARFLPDGRIECLGRMDHQVKLRGFRIELGEIEAVLQRHPLVRQAAVVARTESGVAQSLTGYLVPQSDQRADTTAIREFLSHQLPAYMIPSAFVWMDALPLTPNGKLNAKRLPAPDTTAVAATIVAVAPRNETEQRIAAIWTRILGHNISSVLDDFFTIGGHSLLALRMLSAIRIELDVEIPARCLFETPTIAGLAAHISAQSTAGDSAEKLLIPIQRGDATVKPLFLVAGGWGGEIEFLVYGELSRQIDPKRPIWGLKARGAGTGAAPHATVTEMAADYLREVRRIQPRGPYLIVGECVGGVCAYEMACQLENAGEHVALLVLLDTLVPSDSHLNRYLEAEARKREAESRTLSVFERVRHHLGKMSGLPFGKKVRYLFDKAERTGGHASGHEAPMVEQHPRGQKDYPVTLLRHRPKPYGGTVTLLVDEESVPVYGALGWEHVSVGRLETHVMPGTHITYIREQAGNVAAKLRELLARANVQSSHAAPKS